MPHLPRDKKTFQIKIVGFYGLLLCIMIMGHLMASMKRSSVAEDSLCSIKGKKEKPNSKANEMLFSIKSFSLYEMENVENQ